MLSTQEKDAIQRLKEKLQALVGNRLIQLTLFGSRARNQAGEDSDLDLLVVIRDLKREEKGAILDMTCDLQLDSGVALSPLVVSEEHFNKLTSLERRIAREIQAEGIAL